MNRKTIIIASLLILTLALSLGVAFAQDETEADTNKIWVVKEVIDTDSSPKLNQKIPDFIFTDDEGNEVRLSDFHDRIIFLNFWASWCPPCRKEMPAIQEIHQEYQDEVKVLTVNLQEAEETVNKFMESNNLTFDVILDKVGKISNPYQIRNIPTSFFIDKEGIIRDIHRGTMTKEMMEDAIDKAGNSDSE